MSRALQSLAGPQPAEPWAHSQRSLTLLRAIADGGAYTTDYVAEETGLDRTSAAKALWSACKYGSATRSVSDSGRITYSITEKGLMRIDAYEARARREAGGCDIDAVHRRYDNVVDMGVHGGKVIDASDTITFPTPPEWDEVRGFPLGTDQSGFSCTFDAAQARLIIYSDGVCFFLPSGHAVKLEQALAHLRASGVLPVAPGAAT